jgi:hypothetical protein
MDITYTTTERSSHVYVLIMLGQVLIHLLLVSWSCLPYFASSFLHQKNQLQLQPEDCRSKNTVTRQPLSWWIFLQHRSLFYPELWYWKLILPQSFVFACTNRSPVCIFSSEAGLRPSPIADTTHSGMTLHPRLMRCPNRTQDFCYTTRVPPSHPITSNITSNRKAYNDNSHRRPVLAQNLTSCWSHL